MIWLGRSPYCSRLVSWKWCRGHVSAGFPCKCDWKHLEFSYSITRAPSICLLGLWVLQGRKMAICYTGVDSNMHARVCSWQEWWLLPDHTQGLPVRERQWGSGAKSWSSSFQNSAGSSASQNCPLVLWLWRLPIKAQSRSFLRLSQWDCIPFNMPL